MKLLSLEFKNIGSYGNRAHVIDFNQESSDLILVQGKNGQGKSTIAKALKFTLFGKVDGITLKDIPNRVNKAAYGKVILIAKNQTIVIERGHAPSLFSVTVNGEPIDQAGKKDVQKYIEEEFLGFNFSVFTNILILSINDFKSFLTMRPSDKRKIIDKIFGFYIINEMKEKVKQQKKELRLSLTRIEEAINQIDSTIKHTAVKLEKIEKESDASNKETVKKLKEEIQSLLKNKTALSERYNKLKTKVSTLRSKKSEYSNQAAELSERNRTLSRTLKLYENSACPTCQSPLDTPFHKEIIDNTKSDITSLKEKAVLLKEEVLSVDTQISKAREFENNLIKETQKLDSLMDSKKIEIKKFAQVNNVNSKELTNLISEFEKQKKSKSKDLDKYLEDETFLQLLEEDVLSDEGVKALAIRAVVPVLNKTIEKFSSSLNSKFNIEFDQSFNCIVKELGEEINPNTLSEGERKKADLIIIIAMIEILKLRYPNMNLMFLDELFSSLDQENVGNILFVLKHMLDTLNINIFVISHTELPVQIFDKIVHVFKKGNFSDFNIYNDLSQVPVESDTDK
jgi:DNA repair exonuclease SbcCD ATPase subunit